MQTRDSSILILSLFPTHERARFIFIRSCNFRYFDNSHELTLYISFFRFFFTVILIFRGNLMSTLFYSICLSPCQQVKKKLYIYVPVFTTTNDGFLSLSRNVLLIDGLILGPYIVWYSLVNELN